MKTKLLISFFILLFSFHYAQKNKSSQDIKLMTSKQFETNKDLVFKSVISLLQSEGFLVEDANNNTGLINAYKKNGNNRKSTTTKVVFYIEDFNADLSEVKLTIYEGKESSYYGMYGERYKRNKENMIVKPDVYNTWFNNLRAEIERRRALTQ